MTQHEYEELDSAYEMTYQDWSRMARSGAYTPEEVASVRKDVDEMANALARHRYEQKTFRSGKDDNQNWIKVSRRGLSLYVSSHGLFWLDIPARQAKRNKLYWWNEIADTLARKTATSTWLREEAPGQWVFSHPSNPFFHVTVELTEEEREEIREAVDSWIVKQLAKWIEKDRWFHAISTACCDKK